MTLDAAVAVLVVAVVVVVVAAVAVAAAVVAAAAAGLGPSDQKGVFRWLRFRRKCFRSKKKSDLGEKNLRRARLEVDEVRFEAQRTNKVNRPKNDFLIKNIIKWDAVN